MSRQVFEQSGNKTIKAEQVEVRDDDKLPFRFIFVGFRI